MAHYAFLDANNVVTEVIPGRDEWEVVDGISDWEQAYSEVRGQVCKRTSYNGNIRYNYAGIGFTYDPIDDAFIPPAPCEHEELTLNDFKRWDCFNAEHNLKKL
jgi:hypothetical protein